MACSVLCQMREARSRYAENIQTFWFAFHPTAAVGICAAIGSWVGISSGQKKEREREAAAREAGQSSAEQRRGSILRGRVTPAHSERASKHP